MTYQEGTGIIGGWEKSELRSYLKETINPLIPESVRNNIIAVKKENLNVDIFNTLSSTPTIISDTLWLPALSELNNKYNNLFLDATKRQKSKIGNTVFERWWLREAEYYKDPCVIQILSDGNFLSTQNVTERVYIALGFCF